jgi:hypothetical protein
MLVLVGEFLGEEGIALALPCCQLWLACLPLAVRELGEHADLKDRGAPFSIPLAFFHDDTALLALEDSQVVLNQRREPYKGLESTSEHALVALAIAAERGHRLRELEVSSIFSGATMVLVRQLVSRCCSTLHTISMSGSRADDTTVCASHATARRHCRAWT